MRSVRDCGRYLGPDYSIYHKIVKNPLYRRALIKFRTLNHRLQIETGRWHKPLPIPLNDRKCMLCKCVEDELHFLLICPLLSELRQKYIPNFYYHKASIFKLKMLMISHDYKTINNLAEFIFKAEKTLDLFKYCNVN